MFNLFTKCIFCDNDLPEKPSGVGEHVIPESLLGFWRIYDVCKDCMLYFGDNVDQLGIKNPNLLHSMKLLKIDKVEKYADNMPYVAKDTQTSEKVKMVRKRSKFKTSARKINEEFYECAEEDLDKVAIPQIKNMCNNILTKETIDLEAEKLKEEYLKIAPGDYITNSILGITLKKRQVKGVEYDKELIPSISPLIAKIIFSAIHYFLPLNITDSLIDYRSLRDHARYGKKLRDYTINSCNLRKGDSRYHFHRIKFEKMGHALLTDVTLFGYNNWRSILPANERVILLDETEKEVESLSLYLDFEQHNHRNKLIALKYSDGQYRELPFNI